MLFPQSPQWQFLRKCFTRALTFFRPVPQRVIHQKLDESFMKRFNEVFIIGDVHGCFDEMSELLDKINNDKSILKIFVGDLVNKGPKNSQVLSFMMKNTDDCLSVIGNHDEFSYKCYRDQELRTLKKMFWVESLTEEQVAYLEALPFTISIPSLNCIIVHAGIKPGVPLEEQSLTDLILMRNLISTSDEPGKWQASKGVAEGQPWAGQWTGPQHIYFGHDAVRALQNEQWATGLDTGAVYGKQLTGLFIHGPRKGQYVTVKSAKAYKPIEA